MAKRREDARDLDWNVLFSQPGEKFRGTGGDDRLVGTNFADTFNIRQGGDDRVKAGQGRDTVNVGASLNADDKINGGAGFADVLVLEGDYSGGLTLQTDTISRFETIVLQGDFDYSITMAPDTRFDRNSLLVDASSAQSLHFDGLALDISLVAQGTSGDDVITGGSAQDGIRGNAGQDLMTGGEGEDEFKYTFTSDSLPSDADVITDFNGDIISLTLIDANTQKAGDQQFHLGATPNHVGDITVTYDAGQDVTFVNMFTDSDANPDMVIQLSGDHTNLTEANFLL